MKIVDRRPFIVAFEGIDGSGKDTQATLLFQALVNESYRVFTRSYPQYTSFIGGHIGRLLSGAGTELDASRLDSRSMALWYATDRWRDMSSYAEIGELDFLIFNRFTLSSAVYQSLRSPNDISIESWIFDLEQNIFELPKPDLYVILDTDPLRASSNVSMKEQREYISQSELDVYEQDNSLQNRARNKYVEWAVANANAVVVSTQEPNGTMRSPNDIHSDVIAHVKNYLK
jgi:dTMP kinase